METEINVIREGQEQQVQVQKQNYTVGSFPSGTLEITENGTYNVTDYANANVATQGVIPTGTLEITTNGTHDVTEYASAEVNVEGEQVIQIDPTIDYATITTKGIPAIVVKIKDFDLSNANSYSSLFGNLPNLREVSLKGRSATTGATNMFSNCSSLIEAPQFDTSNISSFNYMFYNCTSLTNVPVYAVQRLSSCAYMYSGCTNLSNEALNNILQMCINISAAGQSFPSSNKRLKYLQLTRAQAQTCTTLSNWSAAVAAGWSTGY